MRLFLCLAGLLGLVATEVHAQSVVRVRVRDRGQVVAVPRFGVRVGPFGGVRVGVGNGFGSVARVGFGSTCGFGFSRSVAVGFNRPVAFGFGGHSYQVPVTTGVSVVPRFSYAPLAVSQPIYATPVAQSFCAPAVGFPTYAGACNGAPQAFAAPAAPGQCEYGSCAVPAGFAAGVPSYGFSTPLLFRQSAVNYGGGFGFRVGAGNGYGFGRGVAVGFGVGY